MSSSFHPDIQQYLTNTYNSSEYENFLTATALPPKFTTLRCNHGSGNDIQLKVSQCLPDFNVRKHPTLPDTIVISDKDVNRDCRELPRHPGEVIVDVKVGKAVLRGADVYVPGVKAMYPLPIGSDVSVMVDVRRSCKRGEKKFRGERVHIANGTTTVTRHEIFKNVTSRGVAVRVTDRAVRCPPLFDHLNLGRDTFFLQNIPSIVVGHVVDPRPGDRILDMCAAPGGKTTHVAHLMGRTGTIIALEKVPHKVDKLRRNLDIQNVGWVTCYTYDSTKCYSATSMSLGAPPYGKDTFDRILLDPPCSGLGQRPQLANSSTIREIASYPKYQWGFLCDAVKMLKPGGVLVYSTCTVAVQENEEMVARALAKHPELRLVPATPMVGQSGRRVTGLTDDQLKLVQRFDSCHYSESEDEDTIGFFIAKFKKID